MSKKIIYIFINIILSVSVSCKAQYSKEDQQLRDEISQMLLVGFRGTELNDSNHIYRDIVDYKIGGVILFDFDAPSQSRPRNITSPTQLKKLVSDLQNLRDEKLIISIDQEGGKVARLRKRNGFPVVTSAQKMAQQGTSNTYKCGLQTANILASMGINLNFAPCTDVNVNPDCPVIGKLGRSFSSNPDNVAKHCEAWINAHHKKNILTSLKHFPGHGSSLSDTHCGIADVTDTWSDIELIPYRNLIKNNKVDMIMTSHVFNAKLDSTYPASLSKKITTILLRDSLKYNGLIVTDDLAMGAIVKQFSFDSVLELAILAGADILCISNNGYTYDPDIVPKAVDIIYQKVKNGRIPRSRIRESYLRIMNLKKKIK